MNKYGNYDGMDDLDDLEETNPALASQLKGFNKLLNKNEGKNVRKMRDYDQQSQFEQKKLNKPVHNSQKRNNF